MGENADLGIELTVAVKGADPAWVPIRLDNQRVVAAREGTRDLDLRQQERGEWQVRIAGEGEHAIRVDVRAAVSTELARTKGFPLRFRKRPRPGSGWTLPVASRTSSSAPNEDFGQEALGQGKGTRLDRLACHPDRSWR